MGGDGPNHKLAKPADQAAEKRDVSDEPNQCTVDDPYNLFLNEYLATKRAPGGDGKGKGDGKPGPQPGDKDGGKAGGDAKAAGHTPIEFLYGPVETHAVAQDLQQKAQESLNASHEALRYTTDGLPPREIPYRAEYKLQRDRTPADIAREQLGPRASDEQLRHYTQTLMRINSVEGNPATEKMSGGKTIKLPGQNADGSITHVTNEGESYSRWYNDSGTRTNENGEGVIDFKDASGKSVSIEWNPRLISGNRESVTGDDTITERRADGSQTERKLVEGGRIDELSIVTTKVTDAGGRSIVPEYAPNADTPTSVTVTSADRTRTTYNPAAGGDFVTADGKLGLDKDLQPYKRTVAADGTITKEFENGKFERATADGKLISSRRTDEWLRTVESTYNPPRSGPTDLPTRISVTPRGEAAIDFNRTDSGRFEAEYRKDGQPVGIIELSVPENSLHYVDRKNQVETMAFPNGRRVEEHNLPYSRAVVVQTSPEGDRTVTERDRNGRKTRETFEDGKGTTMERTFDRNVHTQDLKITSADGSRTELSYDRDLGVLKGTRTSKDGTKETVVQQEDKLIITDPKTGEMRAESYEWKGDDQPRIREGDFDVNAGTFTTREDDGTRRMEGMASGRTDILRPDGSLDGTTVTGIRSFVTAEGVAHIEHGDGRGARLNADGTIDRWGPVNGDAPGETAQKEALSPTEKTFLDRHRNEIDLRDFAEIHRKMLGDRQKLDAFYNELGKIDDAANLSAGEKRALRNNLMRHTASPAEIYQGNTFCCNVSTIQRDMAINEPDKYVSTIVKAVSEGKVLTADGTEVRLDPANLKMVDSTGRDLASRIFQSTAVNLAAHPGRFRNTADGVGQMFDAEGNRKSFDGLHTPVVADLLYKFTGREQAIIKIDKVEDLAAAFERNGRKPMIISVDGAKRPFSDEASGADGAHVVTVTGMEIDRTAVPPKYRVFVQNQWGLEQDHSTADTAFDADELVQNMRMNGAPGEAVTRGPRGKVYDIKHGQLREDADRTKKNAQLLERLQRMNR